MQTATFDSIFFSHLRLVLDFANQARPATSETQKSFQDESDYKERARDYLGEIRALKKKIFELDDKLQTLIATSFIAGLFAIYQSASGDAYTVLFQKTYQGATIIVTFGGFLALKLLVYFFYQSTLNYLEQFYVDLCYTPDRITITKLKKVERSLGWTNLWVQLLGVLFWLSFVHAISRIVAILA